ncbi:DUF2955 domain-containing protein [Aestuariicella hydrocarbonica]|uniref:DUF2955 domain-containing protein n=1 Tax=Pseudomaricurvus hydrocarbonicus TaxID=1470433 RepID=A0A9E5T4G2_9GAMM|nr:DUF2955 domain-containing protein [Aestuariicella hydrocarbonica]NHO67924.1 DUF2955 domain-containing protein [Aestuariicella hydrocarbonica]
MITHTTRLPLAARRSFRLALVASLALALAYGMGLGLPFLAPLLAVILTATPAPPPGPKQLLVLVVAVSLSLGVGILLGPLLQFAPLSALLIIFAGLFVSNRMAIADGKEASSVLLAFGFTLIPAASSVSQALASALIMALVVGVVIAVVCQWLIYPLFPEDETAVPMPVPPTLADSDWLSLRATLIVLPAFLLMLTNPATYLPLALKSILLGRESSEVGLRHANREMLGSTFLGGVCAIGVWICLSLAPLLWFFWGWMLLLSLLLSSWVYGVLRSRFGPSFWVGTLTTAIILLGAAVQDSANGKDVYQAFAVRMALFLLAALYAGLAMWALEQWRKRRSRRRLAGE